MRRSILLISALALVLTACAPAAEGPASTASSGDETTSTPGKVATTQPDGTETTSPSTSLPETSETTSDRPLAPDFTLELAEGGSYTLSEAAKPVYLVFWAEW